MKGAEDAVYFFDTSALVKRYHEEIGTDVVDAAFDEVIHVVSFGEEEKEAALAFVETYGVSESLRTRARSGIKNYRCLGLDYAP